jgi:hypothetical protein
LKIYFLIEMKKEKGNERKKLRRGRKTAKRKEDGDKR